MCDPEVHIDSVITDLEDLQGLAAFEQPVVCEWLKELQRLRAVTSPGAKWVKEAAANYSNDISAEIENDIRAAMKKAMEEKP